MERKARAVLGRPTLAAAANASGGDMSFVQSLQPVKKQVGHSLCQNQQIQFIESFIINAVMLDFFLA